MVGLATKYTRRHSEHISSKSPEFADHSAWGKPTTNSSTWVRYISNNNYNNYNNSNSNNSNNSFMFFALHSLLPRAKKIIIHLYIAPIFHGVLESPGKSMIFCPHKSGNRVSICTRMLLCDSRKDWLCRSTVWTFGTTRWSFRLERSS